MSHARNNFHILYGHASFAIYCIDVSLFQFNSLTFLNKFLSNSFEFVLCTIYNTYDLNLSFS